MIGIHFSFRTTMAYKIGDYLRHKASPEWGVGKVQDVDTTTIVIDFGPEGTKKLRVSYAEPHLERAAASEFTAPAIVRKRTAKSRKTAP
jgi:transcription elongation factor GreA-like protein